MIATEVEAQVGSAVGPTLEIVRPALAVIRRSVDAAMQWNELHEMMRAMWRAMMRTEKKLDRTITCGNYAYGLCCAHR